MNSRVGRPPKPVTATTQRWAKNLRHHRERLGLNQTTVAEFCGVNQRTVSKWENEALPTVPSDEYRPLLSKLFGREIFELFPFEQ